MECACLVAFVAAGRLAGGGRRHGLACGAPARQCNRPGRHRYREKAMIRYIIRRLLYGVLILIGVNLLTFVLFFAVNTPDEMARLSIGGQRFSPSANDRWKTDRGDRTSAVKGKGE